MNVVWVAIGLAMVALGAWMLFGVVRDFRVGRSSVGWPTARGQVTEAKVVRGSRTSHFVIRYTYDVHGIVHEAKLLQAGHNSGSRYNARALESDYAVGTHVDVHYDPSDPDRAVLVPGVGPGLKWGVVGAAIILGFGLYVVIPLGVRLLTPPPPFSELQLAGVTYPSCVSVDADDTVYVCDRAKPAPVTQFGPPTTTTRPPGLQFTRTTTGDVVSSPRSVLVPPVLMIPTGVAVDGSGTVFITDADCPKVGIPDSQVKWGCLWEVEQESANRSTVAQTETLLFPVGVVVSSENTLYVATSSGITQRPEGATEATPFFDLPQDALAGDVAIDAADDLYLTDREGNRVLKIAKDGGDFTELPFTGLNNPDGVAVDSAGNVYVVDSGNNRVLKVSAGTTTAVELPLTGLNQPQDVAVDSKGTVYVTDPENKRVLALHADWESE